MGNQGFSDVDPARLNMVFDDRHHAGILLSEKLQKYEGNENVIVLGIPRGGVVVAKPISERLGLPLSIVVTKKIGAPFQSELAIGAVGPEGVIILDNKLISELGVEVDYIEKAAKEKTDEIARRTVKYGGNKEIKLSRKTLILVDDGIATGATVHVAIKYLKKKGVGKIILTVPVAPKTSMLKFGRLVDELVVIHTPFSFNAVGQFYREFPQVTDEEVINLLKI